MEIQHDIVTPKFPSIHHQSIMPPNGCSSPPLSFPSSSNSICTSSPPYGHESSPVSDDRDIELARLKRMYQNLVEENKVTKSKKRKSTAS